MSKFLTVLQPGVGAVTFHSVVAFAGAKSHVSTTYGWGSTLFSSAPLLAGFGDNPGSSARTAEWDGGHQCGTSCGEHKGGLSGPPDLFGEMAIVRLCLI